MPQVPYNRRAAYIFHWCLRPVPRDQFVHVRDDHQAVVPCFYEPVQRFLLVLIKLNLLADLSEIEN